MKTYIFKIPDDYDLHTSFKMFENNKIVLDKMVDHGIFERIYSDIYPIEEDPYWSKVHSRVASCVNKLVEYMGLEHIVDTCGGIQALEIVTDKIVNKEK